MLMFTRHTSLALLFTRRRLLRDAIFSFVARRHGAALRLPRRYLRFSADDVTVCLR